VRGEKVRTLVFIIMLALTLAAQAQQSVLEVIDLKYRSAEQIVPIRNRSVIQTPQGTRISESVEYRDADTGFRVRPRVNGDRVTLEISSRRDSLADRNAQTFNVQRVDTVVSGRLWEWMEIGGVDQSRVQTDDRTMSRRSGSVLDDRKVFLKVEQIP
jgi:hypothetical protein